MVLDFLQYLVSSIVWWIVKLSKQSAVKDDAIEFEVSPWVDILANNIFYFGKLLPLFWAYLLILKHLWSLMGAAA